MFNKHLITNAHNLLEGKALNIKVADCDLVITKHQGKIFAYENSCPHQKKELSYSDSDTYDEGGDYLKCGHHGALFSPQTGVCVTGPCQGSQLKKATIGIEEGNCYLLRT